MTAEAIRCATSVRFSRAIGPARRPAWEGKAAHFPFEHRPTSRLDGEAGARTAPERTWAYVRSGPERRRSQRVGSSTVVAIEEQTIN
jgi:hypothetical protein